MVDNQNDSVDILLALHNGEKYIQELLLSLMAQTYINFNVIISDDNSSDSTLDVVRKVTSGDSRFIVKRCEASLGSAKANFLYLLSHSRAKYVTFCDQDDVWESNKIELFVSRIKEAELNHGTVVPTLVFSDLKVVDEHLNPISNSYLELMKLDPKRVHINRLLAQNVVTGCACMVNRSLINSVKLLPSDAPDIAMHDYAMAEVAALCGKIIFIDSCPILYRQHAQNVVGASKYSMSKWVQRGSKNEIGVIESVRQARFLSKRCASFGDKELLANCSLYGQLLQFRKVKRIYYLFRYGFWKKGISRKLGQIFYFLKIPMELTDVQN